MLIRKSFQVSRGEDELPVAGGDPSGRSAFATSARRVPSEPTQTSTDSLTTSAQTSSASLFPTPPPRDDAHPTGSGSLGGGAKQVFCPQC